MAKAKKKSGKASVDMTAMCDVAFLLLSFFVMTSTAKLPEPHPVDTPASTVQQKLPEANLAMVTVGDEKVFFTISDRDLRGAVLDRVAEKYNVTFTDEEKKAFELMDGFGVDIKQLPALLKLKGSDRNKEGVQGGIPYSPEDNQLKEWLLAARFAARDVKNDELKIAIKGDALESYPMMKKVIDLMQEQKINKFYLVTGLRGEDF